MSHVIQPIGLMIGWQKILRLFPPSTWMAQNLSRLPLRQKLS